MKKFGTVVAALAVAGVVLPSIASAETVVIRHGDRDRMARAEYRDHDRGWHRGWHHHHAKVVIIRHGHGHRY